MRASLVLAFFIQDQGRSLDCLPLNRGTPGVLKLPRHGWCRYRAVELDGVPQVLDDFGQPFIRESHEQGKANDPLHETPQIVRARGRALNVETDGPLRRTKRYRRGPEDTETRLTRSRKIVRQAEVPWRREDGV